jgi:hypothetical protein
MQADVSNASTTTPATVAVSEAVGILAPSQHNCILSARFPPFSCNRSMQVPVKDVATKPIEGQKTGTSGLRKKTKVFMSDNYLANWVQSLFNALGEEAQGKELGLGGDGRWVWRGCAVCVCV